MTLKKVLLGALIASLVLAAAAALTVFLWPAALTAVAAFSVYGLSIAGLVGANTLLQIGAIAALTAGATSVATLAVAGITSAFSALVNFCTRKGPKGPSTGANVALNDEFANAGNDSAAPRSSSSSMKNIFDANPVEPTAPVEPTFIAQDQIQDQIPAQPIIEEMDNENQDAPRHAMGQ